jgi:hypothetical protein
VKLWLASYPRSGNTFLRMILNEAFGIKSTAVYGSEDAAMGERPWLTERIGYAGALKAIADIDSAAEWTAVKTHDLPTDASHTIYVVRDGRAAIVSYFHMLRAYAGITPSLDDIIEGKIWPGSWSAHFTAWNPEGRPNTLLLRYEDLKFDLDGACVKIAQFLGIEQCAAFTQNFDELNRLEPDLFRTADNATNIAELAGHIEPFNSAHAELMAKLGYQID